MHDTTTQQKLLRDDSVTTIYFDDGRPCASISPTLRSQHSQRLPMLPIRMKQLALHKRHCLRGTRKRIDTEAAIEAVISTREKSNL